MVTLAGPIKKHCNCKNSRCLKLYCECFASGRYCDNCNCVNCCNNKESEQVRQAAVEAILERNPNAFRPKIQVQTLQLWVLMLCWYAGVLEQLLCCCDIDTAGRLSDHGVTIPQGMLACAYISTGWRF